MTTDTPDNWNDTLKKYRNKYIPEKHQSLILKLFWVFIAAIWIPQVAVLILTGNPVITDPITLIVAAFFTIFGIIYTQSVMSEDPPEPVKMP